MSTGGPSGPPTTQYMTRPRRIHMMIDLNMPPPENGDQGGTPTHMNPSNVHARGSPSGAPIDVDALEDEVVVMSPRAFAGAGSSGGRNRRSTAVIDVDSEERAPVISPVNGTRASDLAVINLEGSAYEMWQRQNMQLHQSPILPPPPPPPPPPPEPIFPCPVCMGPLVEETSTRCGHIFCKACIMNSLAFQQKCPTCRKKITPKGLFRIYLPSPDE